MIGFRGKDGATLSDIFGWTERVTGAPKYINTDHALIHAGISYRLIFDIGVLVDGVSVEYSFKAPEDKYVHFKNLSLSSEGATVKAELMRGTTENPLVIDSAGTADNSIIGPNNKNDDSENTSDSIILKTPTYDNNQDGEVWDRILVSGSSTNQFQSVADIQTSEKEEYVFKPDTYYVIRVENIDGADNASDVILSSLFYEEADG